MLDIFTGPYKELALALLTLGAGGIGSLIQLLFPMVRDTLRYRRNGRLIGEWQSAWPDPATDQPRWIAEKVTISAARGKIQLKSIGNPDGYEWEGTGELYDDEYFHGSWKSTNENSKAKGSFMFSCLPEGKTLVGQAIGPDRNGRLISMSWVMGRDQAALEHGKKWINAQAHIKTAA